MLKLYTLLIFLSLHAPSWAKENYYRIEHYDITSTPSPEDFIFWSRFHKIRLDNGLSFQACHNNDRIFIYLSIPSSKGDNKHKNWIKKEKQYKLGPKREVAFHFFFQEKKHSRRFYDYWYWSSVRTHIYNFADDRHVTLNNNIKTALPDQGQACYSYQVNSTLLPLREDSHRNNKASGSRADVRANAIWQHGEWQIVFSRKLQTNSSDDISFTQKKHYTISQECKNKSLKEICNFELIGELRP